MVQSPLINKHEHSLSAFLRFFIQSLTAGLIGFTLLVLVQPQLLQDWPQPASLSMQQMSGPVSYAAAVEKAAPAVVNIYAATVITEQRQRHPFYDSPLFKRFFGRSLPRPKLRQRIKRGLGSGVILDPAGYLVTNHHVIAGFSQIKVALRDGRVSDATLVGFDIETDLAVLKLQLTDLPYLVPAMSNGAQIGDVVLAIGNPYGIGQTVSMGIVSATDRSLKISEYVDFIQTDAAINPGNSGGALINAKGGLVGINTSYFSRKNDSGSIGIGFAIPARVVIHVLGQIIQHGHVIRGWLGFEITQPLANELKFLGYSGDPGILIVEVDVNGPADKAGLRPGDLVVEMDGQAIQSVDLFIGWLKRLPPGSTLDFKVFRKGKMLHIPATIEPLPKTGKAA